MSDRGKKLLLVAVAIVVPLGGIAAIIGWARMRKAAPWAAGLIGAGVGVDPIAYAAKLATKAGVGMNQYALARMMQSEGRSDADRIVRGFVAVNDARRNFGGNVYRCITARKAYTAIAKGGKKVEYARTGYFGEQGAGGRYSTVKEPSTATIALAGKVLRNEVPDTTEGAERFLDVRAFKSQKGVKRTFAQVDAKWKAEGYRSIAPIAGNKDFLVYTRAA